MTDLPTLAPDAGPSDDGLTHYAIRHRCTDVVLCEGRFASLRDCVEAATRRSADLGGADLSDAYLGGADLSDAYLRGAYLRGADLGGADLSDAYLGGADLNDAYLRGAYLRGADLSDAYLGGADLSDAYLGGADLRGAYLGGADLRGACLGGTTWRDGIVLTRAPVIVDNLDDGWRVTILDTHMQIGCECHEFAAWRGFDDARIVAMDGRRALRFWRRYGPALLAMCAAREQESSNG